MNRIEQDGSQTAIISFVKANSYVKETEILLKGKLKSKEQANCLEFLSQK